MKVSVVGASGYVGGELIRLLLSHNKVEISQLTSERYTGKRIKTVHPSLRNNSIKFSSIDNLKRCDILFLCLPHGEAMNRIKEFTNFSDNIIDLSADFRLNELLYTKWYGEHTNPEFIKKFVYGIPEIYRDRMSRSNYISSAGCNATASILGIYPLIKEGLIDIERIFIDVKVGTSEAGNKYSFSSHHPERVRSIRSYKPTKHRHTAEIIQLIESLGYEKPGIFLSASSVDMVRGVLATIQVFIDESVTEKQIWSVYRKYYSDKPFIRIIKEKTGNFRYPDPKILLASNFCDIGFEKDGERLVIISAIDNLMKGAAGQAVQAMNIMRGYDETLGLEFQGIHLY